MKSRSVVGFAVAGARPAVALVLVLVSAAPAHAYDPATTHAGLTERAALASSLHRVLTTRLGRPLGLLEPLQIHSRTLEPAQRTTLWARLGALDPAGGYRPGVEGVSTALAWVVAGSVLAETPPERGRHHFLDPRRRGGLDDGPGLSGLAHAFRLAMDDGATLRDMATGQAFDLTGRSSLEWIASPLNDQGLPAFLDHWERAAAGADPAERESALVRALLALGGILAVLEDAGEPAHVRNDFRGAFLQRQGSSSWDRASSFERFVATRYGRAGVPAGRPPVRRPTLESYFTAADGQGLADRTQRRFFSAGTVPRDALVDTGDTPREVVQAVRDSLALPSPTVAGLALSEVGRKRYLVLEGRRTLAYVRDPRRVRFFVDGAIHADAARALLPEIGGYVAGLADHLLRAAVKIQTSGGVATVTLEGTTSRPVEGTLRLYGEDNRGVRSELGARAASPAAAAVTGPLAAGEPVTVQLPPGTRRLAAVVRGRDSAGAFVAVGEATVE